MTAYFDTSAFVKLLVEERGSRTAAEIWDRADDVVSSILLYPEGRSALRRASRAGRLTRASFRIAVDHFERLWREIDRIPVTTVLAIRAGLLADRHGLRGYDAVHLAATLALGTREVVLVSDDDDLCAAAATMGLAVARV